MKSDSFTDAILAHYLAGDCSADQARRIEAWIDAHPANQARMQSLRAIWNARGPSPHWDTAGMWSRVQAGVGHKRAPGRVVPFPRRRLSPHIAIAAGLVVVAGAVALGLHVRPAGSSRVGASPRDYVTARGEQATIQLSDSSRVTLAPESRLSIPSEFGKPARELALDGEAVFDVVHDAAHPFRVRTAHALVEDVGTRFDLRAYHEDSTVSVAVVEGTVTLGRAREIDSAAKEAGEGVVLRGGDVGDLAANGQVRTARGRSLSSHLSWTEGRLEFAKAPLPEVLRSIGRWYDLDVRVSDSLLATRLVTGTFSTQSPNEMLAALAIAVDAQVARNGRRATLSPRGVGR
jgi:ferric-dicitrate binding protein FerR (iron transport regulator)